MKANSPEDIWKFIKKQGKDMCWQYTGDTFSGRYGRFNIGGRSVLSHRFVYELFNGKIKSGKIVMHKCNNKLCCNPRHLIAGTNTLNMLHASASNAFRIGKTGVKGVSFDNKRNYWTAQGYSCGVKSNLYTGPHRHKAVSARARWENLRYSELTIKEVI